MLESDCIQESEGHEAESYVPFFCLWLELIDNIIIVMRFRLGLTGRDWLADRRRIAEAR